MLHVLDGDATLPAFERASIAGEVAVWREALIDGPWPRALRGVEDCLQAVRSAAKAGDEVVLWFDQDLFCRLHAAFFAAEFPDAQFANALGIHEGRSEVRALFERRMPLDEGMADAWRAYASPDPRALVPLAARFPWLRLHLERYPSADDGLNALERRLLETLRDEGERPVRDLRRVLARGTFGPTSYGLTDVVFERTLAELGPLVARAERVGISHEGREVLAGRVDRTAIAPLDRWLGGVHLEGRGAWRWDGDALIRGA